MLLLQRGERCFGHVTAVSKIFMPAVFISEDTMELTCRCRLCCDVGTLASSIAKGRVPEEYGVLESGALCTANDVQSKLLLQRLTLRRERLHCSLPWETMRPRSRCRPSHPAFQQPASIRVIAETTQKLTILVPSSLL